MYRSGTFSYEFSAAVESQMLALANQGMVHQVEAEDPTLEERVRYSFLGVPASFVLATGAHTRETHSSIDMHLTETRSHVVDLAATPITLPAAVDEKELAAFSLARIDQTWRYSLRSDGSPNRLRRTISAAIYGIGEPEEKPKALVTFPMGKPPKRDRLSGPPLWRPDQLRAEVRRWRYFHEQHALDHLIPAFQAFGMQPDQLISRVSNPDERND